MSEFTLSDLRKVLEQAQRAGWLDEMPILGLGPVLDNSDWLRDAQVGIDARRVCGMIDSMTPGERRQPGLLDPKRCKRIAVGAGVEPRDVMKLVKDFGAMKEVMRRIRDISR